MRGSRTRWLLAVAVLSGVLAAACGGGSDPTEPVENAEPVEDARGGFGLADGGYPQYHDEESGLRVILGTPDLGVGRQRVAFVLSDEQGLIRLPVTSIATYYYPDGYDPDGTEGSAEGPIETTQARFFEFPFGVRGLYAVDLEFDRPGSWAIEVRVPRPDGTVIVTTFDFTVPERTRAPSVGELAPRSTNRTLRDTDDVHELSTGAEPDPAVYELTIAEAIDEGRPLVIVFASPGFCTNALCGPQAELLSTLRERYGERANFIHVDLYENPQELRSDFDRAVRTPLLAEWGLETDEWTFIVNADGTVAARFEAFVTEAELEQALIAVLDAHEAAAGS